jgi:formylglycine-generating enzyme required for sulfatase activity
MKRVAALIVVLGGLAGLLYGIKLYIRYSWPKSVAWMRDLPPADRSTWVTPPVAWTNRSLELEVATPTGYRRTNIVYRVNGLGMALIRVEPGTFWCGLPERQMRQLGWKKETRHQVTLTRPYYLGAYEVTNVEFERFAPAHRARRPSYQRSPAGDLHPAQPVTWAQAQEF